jgi:FKBP-type peptidyl-prolyl cis-trans isomerase
MKRTLAGVMLCGLVACGGDSPSDPSDGTLGIQDLAVGTGAVVANGDVATVHYVGSFTNGNVFENSRTSGQPFPFRVGAGQVIRGWDMGVPGMRVGGRRRLTIPPSLAYGSQGSGRIPPNSTLIFEIELLSVSR